MTPQVSQSGDVVIEARGIVKRFGGAVAVNNVSLAAHHLSSQLDVTPC